MFVDRPGGGSYESDVTEGGRIENQLPRQRQSIQFTYSANPSVFYGFQIFHMRESEDSPDHFRSGETEGVFEKIRNETVPFCFDCAGLKVPRMNLFWPP